MILRYLVLPIFEGGDPVVPPVATERAEDVEQRAEEMLNQWDGTGEYRLACVVSFEWNGRVFRPYRVFNPPEEKQELTPEAANLPQGEAFYAAVVTALRHEHEVDAEVVGDGRGAHAVRVETRLGDVVWHRTEQGPAWWRGCVGDATLPADAEHVHVELDAGGADPRICARTIASVHRLVTL